VQLVLRDTQVVQAQLAQLGHRVFQEYLLAKVAQVLQDKTVVQVLPDLKGYRVLLHNLAVLVLREVQVLLDQ
jgi:hypothetical protein